MRSEGAMSELPWDIGHELATQDNLATAVPIFAVQQRVREWGFEDGDDYEWRSVDDWLLADDEQVKACEDAWPDEPEGWVRRHYRDRWEFVTACLTRKGAEAYIDANGHNLTDPRVYVYSGHRNREWKALREHFTEVTP